MIHFYTKFLIELVPGQIQMNKLSLHQLFVTWWSFKIFPLEVTRVFLTQPLFMKYPSICTIYILFAFCFWMFFWYRVEDIVWDADTDYSLGNFHLFVVTISCLSSFMFANFVLVSFLEDATQYLSRKRSEIPINQFI